MNNEKIKWCLKKNNGIKIILPNENLSRDYMNEANELLENVFLSKGKWKLIVAYYASYNAFYSILMKCGVKSEIHDCTLTLLDFFEFSLEEVDFIKKLKDERIQNQYYLKNFYLNKGDKINEFILKCKEILLDLNDDKIKQIREKIEVILDETK